MPRYICKLNDMYFEWSTVVDAPVTYGFSLEEFKEYYKEEYGKLCFEHELPERLERIEKTGTSAFNQSIDSIISYNRAGPNESCLSKNELIEFLKNRIPHKNNQ